MFRAMNFVAMSPTTQALLAGLAGWAATAIGASTVWSIRQLHGRVLAIIFGGVAGVMLGAAFWSLLAPGVELSQGRGGGSVAVLLASFALGGVVLRVIDRLLPHLHRGRDLREGPRVPWRRSTLLVMAISLHNVPEGLALGIVFGAVASQDPAGPTLGTALALAVGIALHNLFEGAAVAIPLHGDGLSRPRSFWYGQLSGSVEPISAVLGAWLVTSVEPILPHALAFAAGAMIFVLVEELVPESQSDPRHHDVATMATIGGFIVMTVLDLTLG
jgi:zinc transporter, ZIP family